MTLSVAITQLVNYRIVCEQLSAIVPGKNGLGEGEGTVLLF